jgi:uncharacterized protein YegP (UPF0339 family)
LINNSFSRKNLSGEQTIDHLESLISYIVSFSARGSEMDDEWYEGLSAVLNEGEEYDVEIEELSLRGEGIARIKGQIVYVPDTNPGDKVKVKISQLGQRGTVAKVISARVAQFEIFKDAAGKFRFRLKAPNGQIIASSEAYESKDGCKNGIESVKKNAPEAVLEDLTTQ